MHAYWPPRDHREAQRTRTEERHMAQLLALTGRTKSRTRQLTRSAEVALCDTAAGLWRIRAILRELHNYTQTDSADDRTVAGALHLAAEDQVTYLLNHVIGDLAPDER